MSIVRGHPIENFRLHASVPDDRYMHYREWIYKLCDVEARERYWSIGTLSRGSCNTISDSRFILC
jgi:hypothetical protein